jgi:hypothetical protein
MKRRNAVGDVVLFHKPMNAVSAIQACRRELAAFLAPDSGISRSVCLSRISRVLDRTPSGVGPYEAQEVIALARDVLCNVKLDSQQKLAVLLGIFRSPKADGFASGDLPNLT